MAHALPRPQDGCRVSLDQQHLRELESRKIVALVHGCRRGQEPRQPSARQDHGQGVGHSLHHGGAARRWTAARCGRGPSWPYASDFERLHRWAAPVATLPRSSYRFPKQAGCPSQEGNGREAVDPYRGDHFKREERMAYPDAGKSCLRCICEKVYGRRQKTEAPPDGADRGGDPGCPGSRVAATPARKGAAVRCGHGSRFPARPPAGEMEHRPSDPPRGSAGDKTGRPSSLSDLTRRGYTLENW